MENRYGSSRGIWMSLKDEDFEEEEVWDVFKSRENCGNSKSKVNNVGSSSSSPISVPRRLPTAARMIPTMAARTRSSSSSSSSSTSSNSSTSTSSSHETQVAVQQSAPVGIPDWSKIYHSTNKNDNTHKDVSRFEIDHGFGYCRDEDDGEEEEEDEDESGDEFDPKLPPHEIIARRLARSQISSFSVLEGVGRTLKGRDLSKVRNAVLIKTGFLESL